MTCGQLGYGDTTSRNSPEATAVVDLGSGRTAKMVSAAEYHTCAILDDDTLKCWGNNGDGQLGYGDSTSRNSPEATAVVDLGSGRTAKMVSAARIHTCAILDDDTLKCWGDGMMVGELGYGDSTTDTAPRRRRWTWGAGARRRWCRRRSITRARYWTTIP